MTFGAETDESGAHAQLDRFVEAGGTLVDTADVYSAGVSEEIIGRWFADRPADVTDPVVLATKGRFPMGPGPNDGGLSAPPPHPCARRVAGAGSAWTAVDLYQVHSWDPYTPLAETLRTLDGFVRAGKIRYYGFSNFTGWQLHQGGAHGARPRAGRAGDAAAAVQPDRARDRVGDRAGRARRRPRPAALEPARAVAG